MKNWLNEHWRKLLLFIIVFLLIIPLLINASYKFSCSCDFFQFESEASTALTFYGTIIASVIAVYGVFLSIQYSQKNYREDVRNRALPFIVIDPLRTKAHHTMFSRTSESHRTNTAESEGYHEFKRDDCYCILEDGKIEYKTGLSKEQQEVLDNGGMRWILSPGGASLAVIDDVMIPLEIQNVGNGPAIRLQYGFNKVSTPDEEKQYLPVTTLKSGQVIQLHIFSADCGKESPNVGKYVLSFYYDDIYSNRYKQEFTISIEYSEEKHCPSVSIDMEHRQDYLGGSPHG